MLSIPGGIKATAFGLVSDIAQRESSPCEKGCSCGPFYL